MFEDQGEGQARRNKESRARAKADATRRALLDLLRSGPMTNADLRGRLASDAPISVVNYHLSVLVQAGEVVNEDGLYRLA